MKLIPASRAVWMMRIDSSWSLLPQAPNIMAPRHSWLTETPVRPSRRWFTAAPYLGRSGLAGRVDCPARRMGGGGNQLVSRCDVVGPDQSPDSQLGDVLAQLCLDGIGPAA